MITDRARWRDAGLLAAAFLLIGLVVYGRSLGNAFVEWDDHLLITANPIVTDPSWAMLWRAFTTYDPELYIPLTFVSYQLTTLAAGVQPWAFHFGNLLLHVINALLVAWTAFLLLPKSSSRFPIPAFVVGLLFLLHPLHTEAVAWASARKDVLSVLFSLASTVAFLQYRSTQRTAFYAASLGLFLAALLSKVTPLLLPAVYLLIDWMHRRPITRRTLAEIAPFVLASVVFFAVAVWGKEGGGALLTDKLLLGAKATVFYLGKLVIPTGLSVLYPYTKPIGILTPDLLLSLAAIVTMTIALVILGARNAVRWPLAAWAAYLLLLAPTFGTVAKGHNELLDAYFASDRYAYLPSVAAFLAAGGGIALLERWKRSIGVAAFVVIACGFAVLAYRQSLVWRDTETLFRHTARHYPNAYVAHTNLGVILVRRGDVNGGLEEFRKALEIREDATTLYNVGQILRAQGKRQLAMIAFARALRASPLETDAAVALATMLREDGKIPEARQIIREALENVPGHEELLRLQSEIMPAG
ncbi:MAG: Tetratricopeptide TPR2 repeat protein [Candidatus Peregrinibacteria bacterium Gr01-1014_25]|nr:MAG: Tetratricopeptide TPR2 repeat protein [Candidatus Peregrinibacteria bacterium Gr01-1014_25]